ncbi:hypothetical protein B4127_3687 [Bacillus pumilus]|uniref:Uncharacterized protein n=1 Tax=Bacillus pumilus TaxID=1408 RepID=A0AB34QW88_BACPU|nr:hypothetical protein B4127_3687 [Bacillus pumilus]
MPPYDHLSFVDILTYFITNRMSESQFYNEMKSNEVISVLFA